MHRPITIEIVITALRRGKFAARFGDRVILKSSRQPLLDAARILLTPSADPKARIAMRHSGAEHAALSSTIGRVTRLTVEDGSNGRPRFRARMVGRPRPRVSPAIRYPTPIPGGKSPPRGRGAPFPKRPEVRP
jgi:hypothetical protein